MRALLPSLISLLPTVTMAQDLRIVTDIAPIHSLVSMIAGPDVQVDVLVSGAASPHDFQFSFDQAQIVQDADLVIWAGADLTPWLAEALQTLAPDAPTLELLETEGWTKLDLRDDVRFETHDHDDHEGHDHHDHDKTDPHAWLDPRVAIVWQRHIAETLSTADPSHETDYLDRLTQSVEALTALHLEIENRFEDVPQVPYLVPHDAYQYFERLVDRPASGAITLSDAIAPSPARISELQALIADIDVVCVLTDPQSRAEWSDLVRDGTDARTTRVDPMGGTFDPSPDHYIQTITALTDAYAECLAG